MAWQHCQDPCGGGFGAGARGCRTGGLGGGSTELTPGSSHPWHKSGDPLPGDSQGAAGREGVNHPTSWDGLFPSCLGLEEEQLWQHVASSQNNSASHGNYRAAPPGLMASLPAAASWAGQDGTLGLLGALGTTTHPLCHCSSSCVTPGQEKMGQCGISRAGNGAAVPGTALLTWSKGTQIPQAPLPPLCGHTGDTQCNSPPTHGQSVTPFGSSCHDIAWPCPAASPPAPPRLCS